MLWTDDNFTGGGESNKLFLQSCSPKLNSNIYILFGEFHVSCEYNNNVFQNPYHYLLPGLISLTLAVSLEAENVM